ncbi:P22 phage major capsid protein family protein [Marispirochaeta aestuarii]|uniref:P22 phage major capsid protein family protein n=1 Tax=Marispirochaeta aestuarii TaxID=1963862 RepID=UPI0029C6F376|nr:P22 phage major capsid protein family protein [Marispirochaeta aestuarii]
MAIIESIPQIVSKAVLMALEKRLVFRTFFNSDYIGDASEGNSVAIIGVGSATVSSYSRNEEITYGVMTDDSQELPLGQEDYFAIRIDDLDAVQARPDLLAACAKDAVYQLDDVLDSYLAGLLNDGATLDVMDSETSPVSVTSANVLRVLTRMSRLLDEAKVPRERRGVAVPPWFVEKLVLSGADVRTENAEAFNNGWVGSCAGFDIRMSNNTPLESDASVIIGASDIAATAAIQVRKVEKIRLEKFFADGVRGLTCYGGKVTRPACVARLVCTEGEEAE